MNVKRAFLCETQNILQSEDETFNRRNKKKN